MKTTAMYKYSGSQFLTTTIGIQHGPCALTKSKATVIIFSRILGNAEITS